MVGIYAGIFTCAAIFVAMTGMGKALLIQKGIKVPETRKKLAFEGVIIMTLGLLLNLAETKYFGWNQTAQSQFEWVMDIVTGLLYLLGCWMFFRGFFPKTKGDDANGTRI